jgi:Glycosyl hydrolases family 16
MSARFSLGDAPRNPIEKTGYRLEFHDDFDAPTLDTSKWLPFYLSHWSSRAASAARYSFDDSNLLLEVAENQQPWCPEFDGDIRCSVFQTGAFSGPVGSKIGQHRFSEACTVREAQPNVKLYTPQYGYFELRAKAVNTDTDHVALGLLGYEDTPETSAGIDICEIMGSHVTSASSRIGYGVHPWSDPTLEKEFYEDVLPVAATCYHLYALEWTPTHLDFYVDNVKVRTLEQSLHYPMQLMLSIYERPSTGKGVRTDGLAVTYPKQFVVDYVRVYQPVKGYSSNV